MSDIDWDVGRYEDTARRLHPAAEVVVDAADPQPGDRVLDLGCGTGNAALLAAARGAMVTGVDPGERLLAVAADRAAAAGLEVAFLKGDAAAIPLPGDAADIVISVFGVIFAPEATPAAAELARVTRPGGRIVLSAWLPVGAVVAALGVVRRALADGSSSPPGPEPFPWHDAARLAVLFGAHGLGVSVTEHAIAFSAPSAETYVATEVDRHPAWLSARAELEPQGRWKPVREEVVGVLEAANEDPGAFRVTSRYVIATIA